MTAISDKTLADLGWPTLVEHWVRRAATARGQAAIRAHGFFDDPAAARSRVEEISEARALASMDAALPLGGIEDVAAAIERVRKAAALDASELVAVARTAQATTRLRAHLRSHAEHAARLAALGASLTDLGHVFHPILEAFGPDGRLVDHASDALGPLRRALAAIKAQLEKRMKELVEDERYAPLLQDTYYTQRDDRYVLPVRHDGKGFIAGIVHGTSGSGQTLFIEPQEIVELNNKKRLAECDVEDEERRIYIRFSGWIAEEADAIDAALRACETLDVIAAGARLADETVSSAPIVDDAPRVALLHARHPLMLLSERRCVANDVTVAAAQTLVISGPNAGGKTVALKTCGLAALMTRAGLHLTAESGSAMGWFADVRTDIGDAQSLEANLSTFSGHVAQLREYLASAGTGTLLLVDEIAVGTDPEQGAALAQAVLEALASRGVTAIVTTHYDRLKALGATDPRFANASVGFDLTRMEPTFKLHLGVPGSSGALAVARRHGLDGAVVSRAQELLGGHAMRVDELLANVAEQRRKLEEERAILLDELERAEAERVAFKVDREKIRARLDKETRRAHGEALTALKQARRDVEDVRASLRKKAAEAAATEQDVREARRRVSVAGAQVSQHEPRRPLPPGTVVSPEQLIVGAPVIVPSLGQRGVVAAAPERGSVTIRFGAMHATVPIADVLLDSHRAARAAAAERDARLAAETADKQITVATSKDQRSGARTIDTTLDVRGQRADEAIASLDRFLDESILAERDVLFVIHGHGTGALRTAIRAHVATHKAIEKSRAGEPEEGGDGVTVVWLKS
ncbi:MAG TPA: Smr/MutS family protein [Kofleriaceae bacterium]|nr:Smr/MutS family protein [Kofleriaceae bacterium]